MDAQPDCKYISRVSFSISSQDFPSEKLTKRTPFNYSSKKIGSIILSSKIRPDIDFQGILVSTVNHPVKISLAHYLQLQDETIPLVVDPSVNIIVFKKFLSFRIIEYFVIMLYRL